MAFKDRLYPVPVVGTALRVQDRYKQDAGNQHAAAMGFFGFLSLFPVLLLALAGVGFVLHGDPARQAELIDTIQDAIPGFGAAAGERTAIAEAVRNIAENPGAVGLVGLVTLLLAGLRVVDSAMTATERVFRVRVEASVVKLKLRQLGALAGLGVLALAGALAASSVGQLVERLDSGMSVGVFVVVPLVALGLDFVLFLVAYRVLSAGEGPAYRELVPGALLAAVGWTALKIFGATYVSNQVSKANELYGTLGGVIGLLLLLFLAGRLYLYGAELTAVLRRPGEDLAARDDDVHLAADPQGEPVDDPAAAAPRAPEHRAATQPPPEDGGTPNGEQRSPVVSPATRDRLEAADRRNAATRDPHYVRRAIAFVIAVGTVGGLVYAIRPGPDGLNPPSPPAMPSARSPLG